MNIMKNMPDNYIDLAIVDPPYGVNIEKRKDINASKNKKWDIEIPDKKYFDELFRISQKQIIWGMNRFLDYLPNCNMTIIWDKENGNNYVSDYELAWCNVGYNRNRIYKQFWISNMIDKNEKPRIHPAQKPFKLYMWLLQNYAKPGDLILDTHSGSGSCAIACMLEGFDFIAIEKDYDYWKVSVERFETEKSQLKLFT